MKKTQRGKPQDVTFQSRKALCSNIHILAGCSPSSCTLCKAAYSSHNEVAGSPSHTLVQISVLFPNERTGNIMARCEKCSCMTAGSCSKLRSMPVNHGYNERTRFWLPKSQAGGREQQESPSLLAHLCRGPPAT